MEVGLLFCTLAWSNFLFFCHLPFISLPCLSLSLLTNNFDDLFFLCLLFLLPRAPFNWTIQCQMIPRQFPNIVSVFAWSYYSFWHLDLHLSDPPYQVAKWHVPLSGIPLLVWMKVLVHGLVSKNCTTSFIRVVIHLPISSLHSCYTLILTFTHLYLFKCHAAVWRDLYVLKSSIYSTKCFLVFPVYHCTVSLFYSFIHCRVQFVCFKVPRLQLLFNYFCLFNISGPPNAQF